MANNYVFSNETDITAKYISRPSEGGYGGILTFSPPKGTTSVSQDTVDRAMLCSTAQVDFSREVTRQYFINVDGTSYIIGRGQGSLGIAGLLGSAVDFAALFGTDVTDPCKGLFTVKLDAFGMEDCNDPSHNGATLIMYGVLPQRIQITAQIQEQNGALHYQANASFEISGLSVMTGTQWDKSGGTNPYGIAGA